VAGFQEQSFQEKQVKAELSFMTALEHLKHHFFHSHKLVQVQGEEIKIISLSEQSGKITLYKYHVEREILQ
jgi:hypothetical protein